MDIYAWWRALRSHVANDYSKLEDGPEMAKKEAGEAKKGGKGAGGELRTS